MQWHCTRPSCTRLVHYQPNNSSIVASRHPDRAGISGSGAWQPQVEWNFERETKKRKGTGKRMLVSFEFEIERLDVVLMPVWCLQSGRLLRSILTIIYTCLFASFTVERRLVMSLDPWSSLHEANSDPERCSSRWTVFKRLRPYTNFHTNTNFVKSKKLDRSFGILAFNFLFFDLKKKYQWTYRWMYQPWSAGCFLPGRILLQRLVGSF